MDHSKYRYVQSIAKETIRDLQSFIKEGVSERDIVKRSEEILGNKGITSFWYYDVGAFVPLERERQSRSQVKTTILQIRWWGRTTS